MKKYLLLLPIYFFGLVYLLLDPLPVPILRDSIVSVEPGDTWQNPDQRGFYTNLTRAEVLSDISKKVTMNFFGLTIPIYRLNYRPEEAGTLVRDQLRSNYLEEIIYPLHTSYFVNGWEPNKAPFNPNRKGPTDQLSVDGVPYEGKITLKPINSTPLARVIIWTLIFPTSYLVLKSLRISLGHE